MRRVLVLMMACSCAAGTLASHCTIQEQCDPGYYCSEQFTCMPCLQCGALNREAGGKAECVKSVSDCGKCLDDLVPHPSGDVNSPCVPAGSLAKGQSSDPAVPTYAWVIVVVILLLLLFAGIAVYVIRNMDTLKILATTRTSLDAGTTAVCPSAAEDGRGRAPPPYNGRAYEPARPTSPPLPAVHYEQDYASPLIERKENQGIPSNRERDSNQEAIAYHHPRVRFPDQPPSYDDAAMNGGDDEIAPVLADDETVPSVWTHHAERDEHENIPVVSVPETPQPLSLSARLSEARGSTLIRAAERDSTDVTPSKVLCVRQDANHNNTPAPALDGPGPSGITIFVQQHNDVKVFST